MFAWFPNLFKKKDVVKEPRPLLPISNDPEFVDPEEKMVSTITTPTVTETEIEPKGFKLSARSMSRLDGLDHRLVDVVHYAIRVTGVDFGVTQGLRTDSEQLALYLKGASKTMKSKHLTGKAVDVVAYLGSRISWEVALYDDICEAFREGAEKYGVPIRWGAAWHIPNIVDSSLSAEDMMNQYIDLRRSQGKRPFVDAPHFEINE